MCEVSFMECVIIDAVKSVFRLEMMDNHSKQYNYDFLASVITKHIKTNRPELIKYVRDGNDLNKFSLFGSTRYNPYDDSKEFCINGDYLFDLVHEYEDFRIDDEDDDDLSKHKCPVNAHSIHQRMYNKFIEKVGDRRKIKFDEYQKIIDDIVEENPEFADYFFDAVLGDYRWYRR